MRRYLELFTCWLIFAAAFVVADDREDRLRMLSDAETRLKSIYERREFVPATFSGQWLRDSSGYLVLEKRPGETDPELVKYEVESGQRSVVIGKDQLRVPRTPDLLVIQEFIQSPVPGRFLLHARVGTEGKTGHWLCDTTAGKLQEIATEIGHLAGERAFSPQGDRILFGRGPNLYVYDLAAGNTTALTQPENGRVLNNDVGANWSPDGQKIVYIQSDSTDVRQRPTVHTNDPTYPGVSYTHYARVGTPIPTLRVGVVSAQGGDTQWISLPAEPSTFYLNDASWAGNSEELLIELLSRSRDHREFLLINVQSGAVTKAYEETDKAWVDASTQANAGLEWVQGGKAFVLLSERDGWRHASLISRDGQTQSLITKHASDIIARGPVDATGEWLYYLASPENATQRYLYRTRLDGTGDPERLTPADQPGTHTYVYSPDRKWAFHTRSTFDSPPVVDLVELPSHRSVRILEDNAECRRRVSPLISQPTEFLKLDIGNGVEMDAWMIKPRDFDPTRKYPVFVFIYGEPHAQTVLDDWSGGQNNSLFHRMIADFGYLVVSMDGRGTPAPKGAAWRRAVYGSLGPLSTEEQAAGVQALARMKPYVDASRVGIWGWSGGGSNTLNAMFREPDVYHVGIAVAPKPQPDLYNAWFQEIFMRTPDVNPEGYRKAAAINFAEGLRGDLLIIHGTGETNTHIQITEGLVDRLIELGKRFDYMAYPNRDHGLREGQGTTLHLRMLITRYLLEHLPPGPR
jgi:dipeptidyl-peptidase-4